jgi:hypothetical protein
LQAAGAATKIKPIALARRGSNARHRSLSVAAVECCVKTPAGTVLSSRERGELFPQGVHEIAWFPKLESNVQT